MMPDTRIGMTVGHEFIGVVHEVGPSVRNLKPGDRVMVPFNIYCGSCYFCANGLYSNCHNVNPNATAVGGIYGYSHTRSEEHTSELQSLMRISYAVFCLKKKNKQKVVHKRKLNNDITTELRIARHYKDHNITT